MSAPSSVSVLSFTLPNSLQPGDVLLYKPKGFFGWVIRLKTWHPIAHVEVYMGDGTSAASRDGQGVGRYPWRNTELAYVLRPGVPFDVGKANAYIDSMVGTRYGWWDLLNFTGWKVDTKGIVCSPFATELLRAAGVPVFNDEASNLIAPFEFLESELLSKVT